MYVCTCISAYQYTELEATYDATRERLKVYR